MADKLKQLALQELLRRVPGGIQRRVKIGKKKFRFRAGRLKTPFKKNMLELN